MSWFPVSPNPLTNVREGSVGDHVKCPAWITAVYLQVVGVPWPAAVWCAHLSSCALWPDPKLKRYSDWVRDFTLHPNWLFSPLSCVIHVMLVIWLHTYFCLSFRVCLLGVLTLIISWGSLGLELAAAAVSVTMATLPRSLALQWCNPFFHCTSECLQCGCYCCLICCLCSPSLTVSQRLLHFPRYLHHQGNQGKCSH